MDSSDVTGDEGGKNILKRYVNEVQYIEVGNDGIFTDVDTVDDYQRIAPR